MWRGVEERISSYLALSFEGSDGRHHALRGGSTVLSPKSSKGSAQQLLHFPSHFLLCFLREHGEVSCFWSPAES